MARTIRTNRFRYRRHWDELTALYGVLCYYCREEVATTIDHVVPWSYDQDDSLENLVPACSLCNALASNKHFEDVRQKQQFILNRRKERGHRRAICPDCFLPYAYREHSPSIILCAECYDAEYGTGYSKRPAWKSWLDVLALSGVLPEAHAILREHTAGFRVSDKKGRTSFLADAYEKVIAAD
jgi:hypothetical protein